jgi:alkylation response protein AidB-like acyl-CoA dehydrogenase
MAGSNVVERLGLRSSGQRLVYAAVRAGTRAIGAGNAAARSIQQSPRRHGPLASSGLFDVSPTDEQALLRDCARRFAEEVLRPAAQEADEAATPPDGVLERAHDLGLAVLAVPEALGGAATEPSAVTSAIIAEELARGDMGLAVAVLAPLAVVQLIVDWGTRHQQQRYLPSFLGAQRTSAALAVLESNPTFDPARLKTSAVASEGGGFKLWGTKSLVPLGLRAEVFAVAAQLAGHGPCIFLVDRATPGLVVEPSPAMGLRGAGLATLRLEGACVPDGALLGSDDADEARAAFAAAVDRSRVGWCALATGTAQAVLDHVVPYCNDRQAFGEPISNRQGVAFIVANMAIEIEAMRLLTLRAASRVDHGSAEVARSAAVARMHCAAKAAQIGSDGVQLLGGHGYTKEHPIERWYRDLRAVGVFEGGITA